MTNSQMSIGTQLKKLRESKGLTQLQLAEKAGIRRATIVDIENEKKETKIETLRQVCAAMGYEVEIVFKEKVKK